MNSNDDIKYEEPIEEGQEKIIIINNKKNFWKVITSTQTLFYYCALISSWDDRSWFFLVGIYLVILDPSNLMLTALFGCLSSAVVFFFGSLIGSMIDRTSRIKATYIILIIRNISTLICSLSLCVVIYFYDIIIKYNKYPKLRILADVLLIFFGIMAHLTGLANNNIISKDWLPILCLNNRNLLSTMNSRFRLIDLVSKVIAPVIIGQIITFFGKLVAVIVFSIQVSITLLILSFILQIIYKRIPRLHYRVDQSIQLHETEECSPLHDVDITSVNLNSSERQDSELKQKLLILIEGWIIYFKQPILLAGLGLAFLYMTVLGFDSVTIGYSISQGMTESVLSLFNAGAAFTGIVGALIFPYVLRKANIVYTGIISLCLQLVGLIPCIISVWVPGSPFDMWSNITKSDVIFNITSTNGTLSLSHPYNAWSWSLMLFINGIVISRVGLWMYDLTISQLLVETVLEINRGKVNGVQSSLNMLFDMIKFGMVIVLPLPRQFGLLVILSFSAVTLGNVLYIVFAISHNCKITSYL